MFARCHHGEIALRSPQLGEEARKDLIEQAKVLQTSLQAIADRVETVKNEHEKLEGGNKFLQSCEKNLSRNCFHRR